ncbi:hypothetical protein [Lewinella sp. LCG006]|uniref:hypothetical protein n=1 Tax=Lewinella sp. LCG006 TaxID=3231911 RepID=UPI003460E32D
MNKLHNACRLANSQCNLFSIPLLHQDFNYWSAFLLLALSLLGFSQVNAQIGCIGNVNVTLDENCGALVNPEMVLTGNYAAADSISITLDDQESNYLSGCGIHTYNVDVFVNDELVLTCWGNILAEDKTAPILICPEGTGEAVLLNDMQVFRGELFADSPFFQPAQQSCYQETEPPLAIGDRFYSLHSFTITSSDIFTFIGAADYDGLLSLYQGDFLPDNPCQNLIAQSDNTFLGSVDGFDPIVPSINPSFRLSLNLQTNRNYTLVWTSREPLDTGAYGIAIFADNNGRVTNLSKTQVQLAAELICLDVEDVVLTNTYTYSLYADGSLILDYNDPYRIPQEIRNKLNFTGFPEVTDNCGDMLVTVYDELEEAGDCGDWTITRYFQIADRYNSNCTDPTLVVNCTQTIIVRKPTLEDIVLPPFTSIMECDEGFPTDGLMGGPDDNPAPEYAGFPYLSTGINFYNLDQSICNIGASYSDEPRIVTCPGTYYFRREWNIIDWCDPGNSIIYNQIIYVGDFTGPVITYNIPDYDHDGEPDTYYQFSTSPASCLANVVVPTPTVSDGNGCAGIQGIQAQINDSEGNYVWSGSTSTLVQLQIGDYTLTYCATDECANESCSDVLLEVRDRIAPTASCTDALIVSLGGGDSNNGEFGSASLSAEDLNEGSSDHCSTVTLAIRRDEDTTWSDSVDFSCEDIGNTITIHLLVTDTSQNSNTCWLEVTPEDKLHPQCTAPQDVMLSCVELPLSFPGDIGIAYLSNFRATSIMMTSIFGGAGGTDNCAVDTIAERTPNININDCGWGTITRRFEAWQLRPQGDVNGNGAIDINEVFRSTNSCQQVITIMEVHQFTIDFPEDAAADCGSPIVPAIITDALGCDVLAVNVSDPVVFSATGDECYKYSLTYDVINWCLWDGEYDGYTLERLTEDDGEDLPQDRSVEGNERPVVRYNNVSGLVIDRKHNDRDGDSDLVNSSPTLPNYGRYIYTQFIKVYDSTAPTVAVGYFGGPTEEATDLAAGQFADIFGNCAAPVSIPFSVADDCELFDTAGNLTVSLVSATLDAFAMDANGDGNIQSNEFVADQDVRSLITDNEDGTFLFSGEFPIIPTDMGPNVYHALRVLFADGCGNQTSRTIVFDVVDRKGPAPICINGLTVTLMPQIDGGCAMSIWASDFANSAIYDCTGQGEENEDGLREVNKYAIYRASTVQADPNFTPDPADNGLVLNQTDEATTVVYVYAFDEEGNYDYCETYIQVQEHSECGAVTGTIAGLISTENAAGIEGVEVNVSGNYSQGTLTSATGMYTFTNLEIGTDLSVIPYLNTNPSNGVTTFDLVLISKHILGIRLLDSPYKMIAADVNKSESITTLDLIQIRKLVLQISTGFPNNTSWRFIPADYSFPEANNPWAEFFPEVTNHNNIEEEVQANFVGVKIGDVNNSALANAMAQEERSLRGQFDFVFDNQLLAAGEEHAIRFENTSLATLEGWQMALALQHVELVALEYDLAQEANFHQPSTSDNLLLISWHETGVAATTTQQAQHFFTLRLRAKADILLSDALMVQDRHLLSEAYQSGEHLQLGLKFSSGKNAGFSLAQNAPNPFDESTQVRFTLDQQEDLTFRVQNIQGQVIYQITGTYAAGAHYIELTPQLLGQVSGVLSYTLTAGDAALTRKMVLLP